MVSVLAHKNTHAFTLYALFQLRGLSKWHFTIQTSHRLKLVWLHVKTAKTTCATDTSWTLFCIEFRITESNAKTSKVCRSHTIFYRNTYKAWIKIHKTNSGNLQLAILLYLCSIPHPPILNNNKDLLRPYGRILHNAYFPIVYVLWLVLVWDEFVRHTPLPMLHYKGRLV